MAGDQSSVSMTEDGVPLHEIVAPPMPAPDEVEYARVEEALGEFDPALVRHARAATEEVLALLPGRDFDALARHSPELKGADWVPYLSLSVLRVVRVCRALARQGLGPGARVLDFGAYFGNFSLALSRCGYAVDALDDYGAALGDSLKPFEAAMRESGARVMSVASIGYDLQGLAPESYDAVIFMGAIEHVPHTPRLALAAITRVLKPGGVLIMDTPNLGYVYTRRKLLAGRSIFPTIQFQFETELPFAGHHREYLPSEMRWMMERSGHDIAEEDFYCYSAFGLSELRGLDLALWRLMQRYPQLRELYLVASKKIT